MRVISDLLLYKNIINISVCQEVNDALNVAVAKDKQSHEDICVGFLVSLLSEPDKSEKYYRHLSFTARDGLQFVLNELTRLVLDKYLKLKDVARTQLLWLTKELIKNQVKNLLCGVV